MSYLTTTDIRNIILTVKEMNVLDAHSKDFLHKVNMGLKHNCKKGNLDVVQYLFANNNITLDNCDVDDTYNVEDILDESIIAASEHGHLDVVKYLVSVGANVDPNYYYTTVALAARNGHLEVVKYLISAGFVITNDDECCCTISLTGENGHLDIVQYLVSIGANIHAHNDAAIRTASAHGHLEVVQYLVSIGANIHAHNDGATRTASAHGHLEVVQYLVSIGANILAKNNMAIKLAYRHGHLNVVQYLSSIGATL